MELSQYLDILRRRKWLILQAIVIVAVVAGVVSASRTPMYSASARVLLRPNDPAEQLFPANGAVNLGNDPDRYVSEQMDLVTSPSVAQSTADQLPGITASEVSAIASVSQSGASNLIDITATSPDPVRSRRVANTLAAAYIENRRQYAVSGLQRASQDLGIRLDELQSQIARYDEQIRARGLDPDATTGTATATAPVAPAETAPTAPAVPRPTDGSIPTSDEALKAARYAAATQYESLFTRQQELEIDMSLKRGGAEVVAPATTPQDPVSPKPARDAALGAFLGLLLGLGLAFLREHGDDRLRSREEIEQVIERPILAELPFDSSAQKHPSRLAALDHPHARFAESTRSLRTSIEFMGSDGPVSRLLVTSAEPGDGKSLVAANLAAVYAQAGYRTILVDADLRNPRLESIFGTYPPGLRAAGGPRGLSGLISALSLSGARASLAAPANGNGNGHATGNGHGQLPPADPWTDQVVAEAPMPTRQTLIGTALIRTRQSNLVFLPAGPLPPNPAELLGSRITTELLDDLAGLADVVIVDAPPLLVVTDPAVLSAKVDSVVLVASVGATHRNALKRAQTVLTGAGARLLGVVVNRVATAKGGYYGADGYGAYPSTSAHARAGAPSDGSASGRHFAPKKPKRRGIFRRRRVDPEPRYSMDSSTLIPDRAGASVGADLSGLFPSAPRPGASDRAPAPPPPPPPPTAPDASADTIDLNEVTAREGRVVGGSIFGGER